MDGLHRFAFSNTAQQPYVIASRRTESIHSKRLLPFLRIFIFLLILSRSWCLATNFSTNFIWSVYDVVQLRSASKLTTSCMYFYYDFRVAISERMPPMSLDVYSKQPNNYVVSDLLFRRILFKGVRLTILRKLIILMRRAVSSVTTRIGMLL